MNKDYSRHTAIEVPPQAGGTGSHVRSGMPPYLDNSDQPGTKTVIRMVDTTPHDVEPPTASADN